MWLPMMPDGCSKGRKNKNERRCFDTGAGLGTVVLKLESLTNEYTFYLTAPRGSNAPPNGGTAIF